MNQLDASQFTILIADDNHSLRDLLTASIEMRGFQVITAENGLEALKDDRKGQHSIRINQQWRVCFVWTPEGATDVEIVDYH